MNVQGVGDGIGKMPPLALDAVSNSHSRSAIKTWWAAANIDQGGTVKANWPFSAMWFQLYTPEPARLSEQPLHDSRSTPPLEEIYLEAAR